VASSFKTVVCHRRTMSERCAVCGADDVWKQHTLPEDWEAYLGDEHGLDPAEGYYLLPTCNDCNDEVEMQKALDGAMPEMDDDSTALLDGVDTAALLEEAGD
jgi:hypothetical protein